jgi:hypothetical protein
VKCGGQRSERTFGAPAEKADDWSPLLRARSERRSDCNAANELDEIAPPHRFPRAEIFLGYPGFQGDCRRFGRARALGRPLLRIFDLFSRCIRLPPKSLAE